MTKKKSLMDKWQLLRVIGLWKETAKLNQSIYFSGVLDSEVKKHVALVERL